MSGGPSRWRDVVTSFHKHHLPAFRGSCQGPPDCQARFVPRPGQASRASAELLQRLPRADGQSLLGGQRAPHAWHSRRSRHCPGVLRISPSAGIHTCTRCHPRRPSMINPLGLAGIPLARPAGKTPQRAPSCPAHHRHHHLGHLSPAHLPVISSSTSVAALFPGVDLCIVFLLTYTAAHNRRFETTSRTACLGACANRVVVAAASGLGASSTARTATLASRH